MKKKIAFMYFEEIHHIHHFLGIVKEIYDEGSVDVSIITYKMQHSYLYSLLELLKLPESIVIQLPTYSYRKMIEGFRDDKFSNSYFIYKKHSKFILKYDALVFTDINHEYIYNLDKNNKSKFIYIEHGAGDRNYPSGDSLLLFDLINVAGIKRKKFFSRFEGIDELKIKIVGYPKFDVATTEYNNKNNRLFNNSNPIIWYNPHFKQNLSSWYKHGEELLEYFKEHTEYNLIFAPHINLFNLKGYLNSSVINEAFFDCENIHIDLGSLNSVNMTYATTSNVYIGDVSSQVYEFLISPRPCIFINSENVDWKDNNFYNFWYLGIVINDLDNLSNLIKDRDIWQKKHLEQQKTSISETFDFDKNIKSSLRSAKEIIKIVKE